MVYPHDRYNGCKGLIYTYIGVKFGVARFDYDRQFSGALDREASDEWASRFYLYVSCYHLFIEYFDEKPHRTLNLIYYGSDDV